VLGLKGANGPARSLALALLGPLDLQLLLDRVHSQVELPALAK